ncbi:MAG: DEAD/DEAH box helicase [Cellulosilyticaceae bacterium]
MESTFQQLGIPLPLVDGLNKQNITVPLPIQTLTIPEALKGNDLIGQAHTGSGKTLAYLLPLLTKIQASQKMTQAIILSPTHELVVQINDQLKLLAANSGEPITSAVLMGGMNIEKQIERLKKKPHIVVGSSGRVLELIKKKKLSAHTISTLIIDEADNLLDKNQREAIMDIIKACKRDTQLMLFSATITKDTLKTSSVFMKDPVFLNTCEALPLNPNITHYFTVTDQRKKFEVLRKLLNTLSPEKTLVFVNNIHEADIIVDKLQYHKKNANGLFSKQTKQQRENVLNQFRQGKLPILVSSDLSARGLDISNVTHVINMDLPINPFDYLHRAGRTARGTDKGISISIVSPKELEMVKNYQKQLHITMNDLSKTKF